jgi:hypothetical protein
MKGLGKLAEERNLRIQSHLSENKSEIAWVQELVPESDCYARAYEMFDNMGTEERPTIMAHCVYSDEREMEILKKHGLFWDEEACELIDIETGEVIRRIIVPDNTYYGQIIRPISEKFKALLKKWVISKLTPSYSHYYDGDYYD